MYHLEEEGYEVTYLDVDSEGIVDLDQLEESIREDTILVSCMMVNNEIGAIDQLKRSQRSSKQRIRIRFSMSMRFRHMENFRSFQRIWELTYYPQVVIRSMDQKGIGFLYIKEGTKISPIIFGGGQQKGMRSGTENVPGIVGLAVACEKMIGKNYENAEKIREVKEYFQERIKEIEDIKDNSGKAPHVASISFKKLRSEVLLHALEDREIYVSSGSACSSNKKQAVSGTLNAIALSDEFKDGTLRFSFSIENTKEEVDETIKALKELVPMLRRFVRK